MGGPGSGGHNRKSVAEHQLTGTYRASRHDGLRAVAAQVRPDPEREAPSPPSGLSQAALEVWQRFVAAYPRRFAGSNLPELTTLEILVRAVERRDQARDLIDRDGILLEGVRGGQRVHPLVRVEHTAAAAVLKALQTLQLEAEESAPAESPLERIQRGAAVRRGRGE